MLVPCQPSDAREVAESYTEVRLQTVPVIHSVDEIEDWIISNLIKRQSSWVWKDQGQILAWLDLYEGWVDQLYCRGTHTGLGIGKQLLEWAKRQSPNGLELYTFQVNEGARRFYRREGFEEVAWGDGSENEEGQPDVKLDWKP